MTEMPLFWTESEVDELVAQAEATPAATGSDDDACFVLRREVESVGIVARFTVLGEPVSKARARFTQYRSTTRAYTPESTKKAEERLAWEFRRAAPQHRPDPDEAYGVFGIFFAGTNQRRDVDNMLKLICDGLTGVAWVDDSQVEEVSGRRGYDFKENARTEVLIYRTGRISRAVRKCQYCGKSFRTYPSLPAQKHCNSVCRSADLAERRMHNCEQCGRRFDVAHPSRARKFCSRDCQTAAGRVDVTCTVCGQGFNKQRCYVRATNYCSPACRDQRNRKSTPTQDQGQCETCGAPVSRREYRSCRACYRSSQRITGNPIVTGSREDPTS